jgi:hypothetical protein
LRDFVGGPVLGRCDAEEVHPDAIGSRVDVAGSNQVQDGWFNGWVVRSTLRGERALAAVLGRRGAELS